MEITTNPLSLMEQINQLRDKLRPHLGWHGARLSFVALFLIALNKRENRQQVLR